MKYLTLIRHAKSSWEQPGLSDHDRPLNDRGLRAAPAVGTFLGLTYFGKGEMTPLLPPPTRLLSSTALRALTTAQIMRERFALSVEQLALDSRLYLASPEKILSVVQEFDEGWEHVVLFGHNPGMHEFCDRILARASISRMPTCSCVMIALPAEFWALADWGSGQLIAHITPKMLEKRFPDVYKDISHPYMED